MLDVRVYLDGAIASVWREREQVNAGQCLGGVGIRVFEKEKG